MLIRIGCGVSRGINSCRLPGAELHLIELGHGPRIEDRVVLSLCPLHHEPIAPWAKEDGPELRKLIPSLDLIKGSHPLRERLEIGDAPFWTNVGIAPRTRKWFKTRRPRGRVEAAPAGHADA